MLRQQPGFLCYNAYGNSAEFSIWTKETYESGEGMSEGVRLEWQREECELRPYNRRTVHIIQPNLISSENEFVSSKTEPIKAVPKRRLLFGDNLRWMDTLLQEGYASSIDLIYIDPPFMSDIQYDSVLQTDNERFVRQAFSDRWESGLSSYLNALFPRLECMRDLLAPNGNIFIHLDWHVSHYVKILLDELFGRQHLINEIVWCYGGGSRSKRHFQRKHDLIFWYAKGKNYTFNPQYRPYTKGTLERGLTKVKGDKYELRAEGAMMQDWWTDISKILSPTAYENLKYPTQKPKALLERIIKSASNEGDLVADFYGGSGTSAEVCEDLNRNWVLCDSSPIALNTISYRLLKENRSSFQIELAEPYKANRKLGVKAERVAAGDLIEVKILENGQKTEPVDEDIQFWEIDPCFNGDTFCSRWQVLRQERSQKSLPLKVYIPANGEAKQRLAVLIHDLLGNTVLAECKIE